MASSHHTLSSPGISDVMNLLSTMKKQNEEILARNEEILNKLNAIEEDNRQLRQELNKMKSYHNYSKTEHRKRDKPEDEAENREENSNNKKARVASLPEPVPEHGQDMFDPQASFDTLDDDCLGNVLDFVGKKCYSVFCRVNKRCNEMFCSKGFQKETYLFGYGPLDLIKPRRNPFRSSNGVLHYNRRDILDWMLTDESDYGYYRLNWLCYQAIRESRLDILREVFDRANGRQLEYLRDCDNGVDLCYLAANYGKLECLEFLRENQCGWDKYTWREAKKKVHKHILEYLRNNGYPTEWQVDI